MIVKLNVELIKNVGEFVFLNWKVLLLLILLNVVKRAHASPFQNMNLNYSSRTKLNALNKNVHMNGKIGRRI